MHEYAVKLE
jgi:chromosome segregation ATPase